ncbi:MAG TPA: CotH kinase family protein, partial [Flavobacteriales bacterium]|nr:CotH kinase family protein [Flavobacteriales bacterium]
MRSKRKKGSTPVALLTGLGLPLLALFGVFSLIPYERMTDRWPLGITGEEVHAYQRWFDQRPDTMPKVDVPRLELSANGDCDGAREFTLQDHPGSVTLEKDGEERILSFPATSPWNDQHTVRLVPADMSAIKRLYAAEVVRRLGVPSGKAGLVRLSVCGDDQGLFLVLEGVDQDFVEAHGASGDVVFGTRTPVDPLVRREADHALNELTALGELWRIDGRSAAVLGMV